MKGDHQKEKSNDPGHENSVPLGFVRDVNVDYVKTIFSLKRLFLPFTFRKFVFFVLYLAIFIFVSGIVVDIFPVTEWGVYIYFKRYWLSETSILITFLFLAIDPIFLIVSILFGTRSQNRKVSQDVFPDENTSTNGFDDIGIIIACHKSNDVIEKTVRSALKHFLPQNIYVSDNGNNPYPFDDTEDIVLNIDSSINYRWSSVGNKTLAQFLSVRAMMERDDIKYVLIIDDDTKIPENFTSSSEKIDDVVKGVMFGIKGVDEFGKQDCVWTKWQDLEYKLGDLVKEVQCKYASVLFPHGAASLWGKETLFEILGEHDTIFYADDVKMGIFLIMNGYRLYYNTNVIFETEVPSSLIGKSPNYYNQRVRSWDFAEHMCTFRHIKHMFFGYIRGSLKRTVVLRVFQLYVLISIINDWFKIPIFFFYMRSSPLFFTGALGLNVLVNILCICIWNYWSCKGQKNIQVDLIVILTSPIYRIISSLTRVLSVFHCVFIYLPNYKPSALKNPGKIPDDQIEIFEAYNMGKVSREGSITGEVLDVMENGRSSYKRDTFFKVFPEPI